MVCVNKGTRTHDRWGIWLRWQIGQFGKFLELNPRPWTPGGKPGGRIDKFQNTDFRGIEP